uniref:CSON010840 protein n=1 Tax=Culicoides sonorensis TaxID=179676 RepID=A0A336M2K6_CULSO
MKSLKFTFFLSIILAIFLSVAISIEQEHEVECDVSEDHSSCSFTKVICQIELIHEFNRNTKLVVKNADEENFTSVILTTGEMEILPAELFAQLPNLLTFKAERVKLMEILNGTFELATKLLELDLNDNEIKVITKSTFAGAENLRAIDLDDNEIESIPVDAFKSLTKLEALNLARNKIKFFEVSTFDNLSHLKTLDLKRNPIEKIHPRTFAQNQMLISLNLRSLNKLEELELEFESVRLRELELGYGNLKKIKLRGLSKSNSIGRVELDECHFKSMSDIQIDNINIKTLELYSNKIHVLDGSQEFLRNLSSLDVSANGLVEITDVFKKNLKALTSLDLRRNSELKMKDGMFDGLDQLKKISLSYNYLKSVESTWFKGLPKLEYIDLHYNYIKQIDYKSFEKNVPSLKTINLKYNNFECDDLKNLVNEMKNETYLRFSVMDEEDCSKNEYYYFNDKGLNLHWYGLAIIIFVGIGTTWILIKKDSCRRCRNSQSYDGMRFNESSNTIQAVNSPPISTYIIIMPNMLIFLTCAMCKKQEFKVKCDVLEKIWYSPHERTCKIDLKYLIPSQIDFKDDTKLVFADAERKNITSLILTGHHIKVHPVLGRLPNLIHLESLIGCEEIRDETFIKVENLVVINLSSNKIKNITSTTFLGPENLRTLNLYTNEIETIPVDAFSNLVNLLILNLAGNKIKFMGLGTFHGLKNLVSLDLSGNQIGKIHPRTFVQNHLLTALNLSKMKRLTQLDMEFEDVRLAVLNVSSTNLINISLRGLSNTTNSIGILNLMSCDLSSMSNISIDKIYIDSLDLGSNKIKVLDGNQQFLKDLSTLLLDDNELVEITPMTPLESLQTLNLSRNSNLKMRDNMFAGMNELSILSLRHNNLISVKSAWFKGLPSLQYLDLYSNNLRKFDYKEFENLTPLTVNVNRNKFFCVYLENLFKEMEKNVSVYFDESLVDDYCYKYVTSYTTTTYYIPRFVFFLPFLLPFWCIKYMCQKPEETPDQQYVEVRVVILKKSCILECFTASEHQVECDVTEELNSCNSTKIICEIDLIQAIDANTKLFVKNADEENFTSLILATAERVKIKEILNGTFIKAKNLIEVNLSYNLIKVLPTSAFIGVENLVSLDLYGNQIEEIAIDAFNNLIKLESLNLGDNKIKFVNATTFDGLKNLKSLDLKGNHIETIHPRSFFANKKLVFLDLSSMSELKELELEFEAIKLRKLKLGATDLKMIKLRGITDNISIDTLELNSCELSKMSDINIDNIKIKSLELGHNKIQSLDDVPELSLRKIENLYLYGNLIEEIPEKFKKHFETLKNLNLGNNYNLKMTESMFNGLKELKRLSLSNNQLKSVDSSWFKGLSQLEYLDLAGNQVNIFDYKDFAKNVPSLRIIDLNYNHFQCDYMKNFTAHMKNETSIRLRSHRREYECTSYDHLYSPESDKKSDLRWYGLSIIILVAFVMTWILIKKNSCRNCKNSQSFDNITPNASVQNMQEVAQT